MSKGNEVPYIAFGKGVGGVGDWKNGLFGCFGNMGNCKFIGEALT